LEITREEALEFEKQGIVRDCKLCNTPFPLTEFTYHKLGKWGHVAGCRTCINARNAARRAENPEKYRASVRASKARNKESVQEYQHSWYLKNRDAVLANTRQNNYGITSEQYDALMSAQSAKCGICDRTFGNGKSDKAHVDHCHTTGKIRGLLCGNCNLGIGNFQDRVDLLLRASEYLNPDRALVINVKAPLDKPLGSYRYTAVN
jgi:hypothetical protein